MSQHNTRLIKSRVRAFVLFVIIGSIGLPVSCCYTSETTIASWDSSELERIEKKWDLLQRKWPRPKDDALDLAMAREALLAREVHLRDAQALAETCETIPVRARDRSRFHNAVLRHIVRVLVENGKREGLVTLLSKRCPNRVRELVPLELYLAESAGELKCPLLILGAAHSRCKSRDVRRILAGAVRRAFAGFDIAGEGDDEYIANAMEWYQREYNKLDVNARYRINDKFRPVELYERSPELFLSKPLRFVERQPLFIWKPNVHEDDGENSSRRREAEQ